MKHFYFSRNFIVFILTGVTIISSNDSYSQMSNKSKKPETKKSFQQEFYGADAEKHFTGASYYFEGINTVFPAFVSFNSTQNIRTTEFFNKLQSEVHYNAGINFRLTSTKKDEIGFSHSRYEQTFKNLPVADAEIIVHEKNNHVESFNGYAIDFTNDLSVVPVVDESTALSKATSYIGAQLYNWQVPEWEAGIKERTKNLNATYFPTALLCWYVTNRDDEKLNPQPKLAYLLDIYASSPFSVTRVYVDAQSGEVLGDYPLSNDCSAATVNTAFNGVRTISTQLQSPNVYGLKDDCQLATIRVRDWNSATAVMNPIEITSSDNTWDNDTNRRFGATALWCIEKAYMYWLDVRNRSSYNDSNGVVDAYINAIFTRTDGTLYKDNAAMLPGGVMWIGRGNNPTNLKKCWATVDLIGHEYTHAVTRSSSNLVYQNESGALNESFSDIFGEAIENYTLGSNNWLIGSERKDTLRSLAKPKLKGQPDTYQGTNWYVGADDNGGVHTNSGVQNYWFYLLAHGGSGTNDNATSYSVACVGLSKAAAIAARTLTVYLTANCKYFDARVNSIQSAIDLYGASSYETSQVIKAWNAVGVRSGDSVLIVMDDFNGYSISCNGGNNSFVTLTPYFGTQPYTFLWSNGQTANPISNLTPGTYTATITDATGKIKSTNVIITQPPAMTITPNCLNVSCFGKSNGQTLIGISGGVSLYWNYLWSTGNSNSQIKNKKAGTYTVTATDKNNCTTSASVIITQPNPLPIITTTTQAHCAGEHSGSIQVTVTGLYPPFSFLWNDGSTMFGRDTIPNGVYTITITNGDGCTSTATAKITAQSNMVINIATVNHKATATVSGGKTPYSYLWNTVPPQTTKAATGLTIGQTYQVTVTDSINCTKTTSVTMPPIRLEDDEAAYKDMVYPNPFNDFIIVSTQEEDVKPELKLFNSIGEQILDVPLNKGDNQINTNMLTSGFYYFKYSTETKQFNFKLLKL